MDCLLDLTRATSSHLESQGCLQLFSCVHTMELLNQKEISGCLKYICSSINVLQDMQIFGFYSNVLAEISRSFLGNLNYQEINF